MTQKKSEEPGLQDLNRQEIYAAAGKRALAQTNWQLAERMKLSGETLELLRVPKGTTGEQFLLFRW